jgi:hypothetical protein
VRLSLLQRVRIQRHLQLRRDETASAVDATAGRGLVLVSALADAWGIEPDRDGKIVWVELAGRSAGPADGVDPRASGPD